MSNRKDTFAKRKREADLKDRARAKAARLAARRALPRTEAGPGNALPEQPPPAPAVPDDPAAPAPPGEHPLGVPKSS